jgi:transposase InsO family protein
VLRSIRNFESLLRLRRYQPPGSRKRKGSADSYDNALAETINGLYKAEIFHRRGHWKTQEAVELATLEWVSWFNHHRPLEPIGYIPPAEAEANCWKEKAPASSTTCAARAAAQREG